MESIGKAVLIFMLAVKSLSPSVGPKAPSTASYVPDPDRPYVMRIAILPFDNITSDPNATDKMHDTMLTYLLHTQVIGVVDPDLVEQTLFDQKVRKTSQITPKIGRDIKQALRVDALLAGKITAYQVDSAGGDSIPVIAINARLLDPDTMDIIWSMSFVRKGNDKSVLFDIGRIDTLSDLSQLVANDLASSLGKQGSAAIAGYRKKSGATMAAATAPAPPPLKTTAAVVAAPAGAETAAAATDTKAAAAALPAPIANLQDYLPEVEGYTRDEVEVKKHGVPSANTTYRKGAAPIFVRLMDCGNGETCKKLKSAMMIGADEGSVQLNGDTGAKAHGKMGMLEYYAVHGRFLLIMSAGDPSADDMKLLGSQLLKHANK